MKKIFHVLLVIVITTSYSFSQQKFDYKIKPAELKSVKITGGFWQNRFETNQSVTIPHVINKCETTGRLDNLLFAAGIKNGEYCTTYQFDDSDIFKTIEAVAYSLIHKPDAELDNKINEWIDVISKVQEEDGYIYSPRVVPSERIKKAIGKERWSNLQWSHELYNMGHLYEAAAAHYKATGKESLLNIALKNAELICNTFNKQNLQIPPGHEEIEIGLIKLYEITGVEKYLQQAKYFIELRGRGMETNGRESWSEYAQDHKPIFEQDEAVGHAVRAAYLYSAMADVAALTEDKKYINAVDKLWENVISKKLYVTGGIGATGTGEALGENYDLPNASAYNETCSSIANMMWNYRMFLLHGDGKYLDVFERTLYNAFLSGIGMDGKSFFYPNPLQSYGTHERSPWFTCACCPPNVARFIASLPGKIYAISNDKIFINLFASSTAELKVKSQKVFVEQETNYPWDGLIKIIVRSENPGNNFKVNIRIPGWATGKPMESDLYRFLESNGRPVVKINGKETAVNISNGFIEFERQWNEDEIEIALPMEINRIEANTMVDADKNKYAIQRGPLIYCAEWADNKNGFVRNILLPKNSILKSRFESGLLGGIQTIEGNALGYFYDDNNNLKSEEQELKVIPYYAWSHRGKGEMNVWLPYDVKAVSPLQGKTLISLSKISSLSGKNLNAVNDQIEPANSADESVPFFHWWPNKGSKEFVQIDFPQTSEISQVEIYWFDDTGTGECKVPEKWNVLYNDNNEWHSVYSTDKFGNEKNKFNCVSFETVRTNSLKIEIQSQKDFAGGIHEIKIK